MCRNQVRHSTPPAIPIEHRAESSGVYRARLAVSLTRSPLGSRVRTSRLRIRCQKPQSLGLTATRSRTAAFPATQPTRLRARSHYLLGPVLPVASMDKTTQNCISCHNGGSTISPAIPNVFAEFAKKTGHPFPTGHNQHSANESGVLNNNRHATCVDCHDPHASNQTAAFALTTIRSSQYGASGSAGRTAPRL